MGEFGRAAVFIITATVAIGVMVQLAKNPAGAGALFAGGVDTVNGVIHGMEGGGK